MRRVSLLVVLAILGALVSAQPVSANDVTCSSSGGVIATTVNDNVIVDTNCIVGPTGTVNGNLIEPTATGFSITVQLGANIDGDIEERGVGSVRVEVGSDDRVDGSVKEEDAGSVAFDVRSGGKLNGNIIEKGAGNVSIVATSFFVFALAGEFDDV